VVDDQTTQRVSDRVVRRVRRKEDELPAAPTPAPAPPVVARASVPAPAPAPAPAPVAAAPVAPPADPPRRVIARRREPEVVERAPEPVVEPVAARAPEPAPVVAPAPAPVAAPTVAAAPAPAAPAPAPAPVPAPSAPTRSGPPRTVVDPSQGSGLPESPRFVGLGKAVVAPPPGYDPSNPASYRPRPGPSGPGRATVVAPPPAPVDDRRGAPPGSEEDRRNRKGRRAGRTAAPTPAMQPPIRRKGRRKGLPPKASSPGPKASKRKIRVDGLISVGQLAHELGVKAPVIIRKLMELGTMATVNELLDVETAAFIASDFEYEVENVGFTEDQFLQAVDAEEEEVGLTGRPPVVTIMGHVDHGKTTLLDALRSANVASGEAGGITQHIGAYQVELRGQPITFIDTPGHAAFTEMRARGASVTDIVVLVVAADDGVQAQTIEAINHAKSAGVPIVVAVNKIDRPGVNPDTIKHRLGEYELVPEEWGGSTMFVAVSALKRIGLDDLLEQILLQAEVLELRANAERFAEGIVIEARQVKGIGPVATVLVQKGTLNRGDNVVLGAAYGKVRTMTDHRGAKLKTAGPSMPVELSGLTALPLTGDRMVVVKTEKDARTLAEHRATEAREAGLKGTRRRNVEDLFAMAANSDKKILHVVIKADVGGSLEALRGALEAIHVEGTELRVLHAAVGDISESDVGLVAVNNGLLLGFNVKVDPRAKIAAEANSVAPETYRIIYDVLDRVKFVLSKMVDPTYEDVLQGTAEVRKVFLISKVGAIAGCFVKEGKVSRNNSVRLVRNNVVLWEGKLATLKRFKDDVREVTSGYECGIRLDGFDGIEDGDVLECFARQEVAGAVG
jgi:translation initiation factor IF-2